MEVSRQNMLSVNEILADVLVELNDEANKLFTKGFYTSQIQKALSELAFDTLFHKIQKDYPFPTETLNLPYPDGCFNLDQIYVYNSKDCAVESMMNVRWKDRYVTGGKDMGYTAEAHSQTNDNFINYFGNSIEDNLYFGVQNGIIYFSSSCSSYDRVRVVFYGTPTKIGDVPFIPEIFRSAVIDYVCEKCYRMLKARNPNLYRILWSDVYNTLYKPFDGTWDKALYRMRSMDEKMKRDLKEYLSAPNE